MIERRLADQLGGKLGLNRHDSEELLRKMTKSWAEILKTEGELSLPALGRLKVKERSSRTIVDVRTKARRVLFQKKAITFRPLPQLKNALNPDRPAVSTVETGVVPIPIRITHTAPRTTPPLPPPPPDQPRPNQKLVKKPTITTPIRVAGPPERTTRNLLRALSAQGGNRLLLHSSEPVSAVLSYDGSRLISQTSLPSEVAASLALELEHLAQLTPHAPGSFRLNLGDGLLSVSVSRLSAVGRTVYSVKLFDPQFVTPSLRPFGFDKNEELIFLNELSRPGVLLISAPPGEGLTSLYLSALCSARPSHHPVVSIEHHHLLRMPEVLQLIWPEEPSEKRDVLRGLIDLQPTLIGLEATAASELNFLESLAQRNMTLLVALPGFSLISTVRRLNSLAPRLAPHVTSLLHLRLLPRLCPDCLVARRPTAAEARQLQTHLAERAPRVVASARGCEACLDGHRGRLPIVEQIPFSQRLDRAFRTGDHHQISAQRGHSFKDKLLLALERGEVGLSAFS